MTLLRVQGVCAFGRGYKVASMHCSCGTPCLTRQAGSNFACKLCRDCSKTALLHVLQNWVALRTESCIIGHSADESHLQSTKSNLLLCLMLCPGVKKQAHFTTHASLSAWGAKHYSVCLQNSLRQPLSQGELQELGQTFMPSMVYSKVRIAPRHLMALSQCVTRLLISSMHCMQASS